MSLASLSAGSTKASTNLFHCSRDGDSDYHRNRHDSADLAHLDVGCVQPKIGPVDFERTVEEGLDPLIDYVGGGRGLILVIILILVLLGHL
jgi:hypothetical protein